MEVLPPVAFGRATRDIGDWRKSTSAPEHRAKRHGSKRVSVHSVTIDPVTELSSWFISGLPRDEVKRRVKNLARHGKVGEFLVRDKNSAKSNFALVVVEKPRTVVNFLISSIVNAGQTWYRIDGAPPQHKFESVAKLISFYCDVHTAALNVRLQCNADEDEDALPTPARKLHTGCALTEVNSPVAYHSRVGIKSPQARSPRTAASPGLTDAQDRPILGDLNKEIQPTERCSSVTFQTPPANERWSHIRNQKLALDSPLFPSSSTRPSSLTPTDDDGTGRMKIPELTERLKSIGFEISRPASRSQARIQALAERTVSEKIAQHERQVPAKVKRSKSLHGRVRRWSATTFTRSGR